MWERHCNEKLRQAGFEPVGEWHSLYRHKGLKILLAVYVDDFKMAGPKANMNKGWKAIRNGVTMEDPTPFGLYLGCTHRRFTASFKYGEVRTACPTVYVPNKEGDIAEDKSRDNEIVHATGIEYDCQPYLLGVVQRYAAQILRETGKPVVLNRVGTPFLTDSAARESPQ